MKFYNREQELLLLDEVEQRSRDGAQMTVVVGRRRIGKTSLLQKSCEGKRYLYFFVARKNETLLCEEFVEEVRLVFHNEMYGSFHTFRDLFGYLLNLSKTETFTLVIDEFQEFITVNPSVFSEMQNLWDRHKTTSKMHLVLCGSIYSMMTRLFEHSKEPLFGRATQRMHLKAFSTATLKEIYADYYPSYASDDLLAFYAVTGGVAKYVELLVEARAFTIDAIIDRVCSDNSLFLDEGKNILIDEIGKDYGNYFSILSLIASSKTSRVEIESILDMPVGGFLDRLEVDFDLISKVKPVLAKPGSRSVKYFINDNYLGFWFRFVYKHRSAVEIGNMNYLKEIVHRDYTTFSGKALERYFIDKLRHQKSYSTIGSYWEKGNHNEIDIVAINDLERKVLIAEVKRNPDKISISELKKKAESLVASLGGYTVEYRGFSLNDM